MAELEQRILTLLSSSVVDPITRQPKADGPIRPPMKTIDIAKELFGTNGESKMVNPTLYGLEKKGLLVKIADEGGKNPRWTVAKPGAGFPKDDEKSDCKEHKTELPKLSDEEAKARILEVLRNSSDPVPTLTISRALYGPKATRKMVNSQLYSLLSKNLVSKSSNPDGTNPHWSLVQAPPKPTTQTTMKPPAQVQLRIVS